ncbi:MAG: hypothetical protein IT364_16640 [Candidatus Hydrogenedentes bacterium]|nr:hypothetical protein [Candidatus Hydrogenedentota bacterium]
MRRKYLKDSVTGKPYDPDTGQYILDELADSVLGDLHHTHDEAPAEIVIPRAPEPAPSTMFESIHNPVPPVEEEIIKAPDLFDEEPPAP